MKTEEIKDKMINSMQEIFNKEVRPLIVKEMKKFRIKSIKQTMGTDFITMNNGMCSADVDFIELSEAKANFFYEFINTWNEAPFYTTIDHEISI